MYNANVPIDVTSVINNSPLGALRIRAIFMCAIVALLDGFDTQAIAFVAPAIATEWGVDRSAFGTVFGAGLLGLTVGALALGPVADRVGRKIVIVTSTAAFGLFALMTPLAGDITTLAIFRFLTGLGLGGAMPNIIALTSEYAPARMRATLVTAMFCGFPMGAVLGGLFSAPLIAGYGWQSVFIVGGALPLLIVPLLWVAMPESIRFLFVRSRDESRAMALLRQIDPDIPGDGRLRSDVPADAGPVAAPVTSLLSRGRAAGTLLLWCIFFSNLLTLYFLVNWLPTLLLQLKLPMEQAILSIALLNGTGIVGGLALGWWIDRRSPSFVLGTAYAFATLAIVAISLAGESVAAVMTAIGFAGLFVIGTQFGMNALAAAYYPTAIRATGVGWALGVGRIGSIVGPVLGGLLLAQAWEVRELLLVAALPSAIAAVAVVALHFSRPAQALETADPVTAGTPAK